MKIRKSLIAILIIVLLAAVLTGCQKTTTTTANPAATTTTTTKAVSPFTDTQLKQLLTDAVNYNKAADTYKFNASMSMKVKVDGKAEPGDMNVMMNGAVDIAASQMMMSMNMEVPDEFGNKQNQNVDMYLLDGKMYMHAVIPGIGEQWIKTEATEEIMRNFDVNVINQQMETFDAPDSIEYVREDSARGVPCYVLKVIPNADYLRKYAEENMTQGLKIDWDKVKNVQDLYKNMNYYVWITKDTKQMIKMENYGTMEFTSDFASSDQLNFKTFLVDMNIVAEMYDHGAAVKIELPAEAQNAIEISPDALLGQ